MKKIYLSLLLVVSAFGYSNAQIVINEVYGGGGNSGATYKNDFVELINNTSTQQTLTGAYLQYASNSGTFGSTSNPLNNKLALPNITLNPGQTFLIQLAQGSGGTTDLIEPDFAPTGTTAPDATLSLSGTGGKIALTSNDVSPTSATDPNVLDFVGWGTSANMWEGTGRAPATTNTTSISRTGGIDNNDNATDFTAGTPSPLNSKNNVTPVNLLDFTLVKGTNGVELSWKTAQEKDTKEFIIEYSTDNNNWSEIAKVPAAGNSSTPLSYAYTHENPANGVNYYRLKTVDLDGSFEYFTTKSINLQNEISIKLYPNPAKDFVYISTTENKADLSYNIYNAAGAKVLTGNVTGNAINISKLASGIYFVKISKVGGATTTVKIVKQ